MDVRELFPATLLFALLAASTANATQIGFTFNGSVIDDNGVAAYAPGTPVSGTVVFDANIEPDFDLLEGDTWTTGFADSNLDSPFRIRGAFSATLNIGEDAYSITSNVLGFLSARLLDGVLRTQLDINEFDGISFSRTLRLIGAAPGDGITQPTTIDDTLALFLLAAVGDRGSYRLRDFAGSGVESMVSFQLSDATVIPLPLPILTLLSALAGLRVLSRPGRAGQPPVGLAV